MVRIIFRAGLLIIAVAFAFSGRVEQVVGAALALDILSNLLIAAIVLDVIIDYLPVTVKAPIAFESKVDESGIPLVDRNKIPIPDPAKPTKWGEVRILRKDVNISNLNNLFSTLFFGGGFMHGPTRQALIEHTNPLYWRSRTTHKSDS